MYIIQRWQRNRGRYRLAGGVQFFLGLGVSDIVDIHSSEKKITGYSDPNEGGIL